MNAIILAAGTGSRMGTLTAKMPKCLLRVAGQTIIEQQYSVLRSCNVARVAVVLGHCADAVRESCAGWKMDFFFNPRFEVSGMLESLYCARDLLDEEVLLVYGDVYFTQPVIETVLGTSGDIVLASVCKDRSAKEVGRGWPHGAEQYYGRKFDKGNTWLHLNGERVVDINKTAPVEGLAAEYIGIAKISADVARELETELSDLIRSGHISHFPSPSYLFRAMIQRGRTITAARIPSDSCVELDFPEDVDAAQHLDARINPRNPN